jgi:hypothetical protein
MTVVTDRPRAKHAVAEERTWFPGWRPLVTPLLAWFSSRVVMLAAIAVGNHLRGDGQRVVDALHRWDGTWYLRATAGYNYPDVSVPELGQVNIAFFPLFPFLIRVVRSLTGWTPLAASLVVTAVFGALAIIAIWLLVHHISGRDIADRAALLVAFFPGTIALTMVYSEGVMVTAAAGCLLALLHRNWWMAGVLGALASAARPNGIALALACAVAACMAIARDREWRALVAPALAPLGMIGYLGWLWANTGAANVWFRVQDEGWGEGIDFGARTVGDLTTWYARLPRDLDFLNIPFIIHLRAVGLIFVIVTLVLMIRWRPPAVIWAYTIGILAPSLLSQTLGARPRFIFTAFPLVVALAWSVRGVWYSAVLASTAVLLALSTIIYTTPGVVAP